MKPIFITTPIFYANAKPHLGHAYTLCIADAWARYARIQSQSCLRAFPQLQTPMRPVFDCNTGCPVTFLSTGVDEHGIKVERKAKELKMKPQDLCDQISSHFKDLSDLLNIEADTFIRTTSLTHCSTVEEIWKVLEKKGYLYWDQYRGWYSATDEAFYEDWEVEDNTVLPSRGKVAKLTGNSVEWVEEETCRFRLKDLKPCLHQWLDSGVLPKSTSARLKLIEETHRTLDFLEDPSVSRPSSRVPWGIPVPGRTDQTIYVWFDALLSYLTVSEYRSNSSIWPPDFQFIGKDITRFHTILFPAILLAADLPLPRMIIPHAHIVVDGMKMSKSLGNVLSPSDVIEDLVKGSTTNASDNQVRQLAADCLRYCLIRSVCLDDNSSFQMNTAKRVINTELVNHFGNLLFRLVSERLNPTQSARVLQLEEARDLLLRADLDSDFYSTLLNLRDRFHDLWWHQLHPNRAIDLLSEVTRKTNSFLQRHKPWEEDLKQRKTISSENVLSISFEAIRLVNCFLFPVVPHISDSLFLRLGIGSEIDRMAPLNPRPLGKNETQLLPRLSLHDEIN